MNLYIDYSEFELTCWNTDGKGTNVAIPLTEEQAKKICDIRPGKNFSLVFLFCL